MFTQVVVAAGVVASVQVTVEALGHSRDGWLVVLGYEHDMTPILTLVHDADVLDIDIEAIEFSEMDEDLVEAVLIAA